jgi:hypothetical protein
MTDETLADSGLRHRNLATALAAVQAELPDIRKSLTAKVKTRDGNTYTYDYADLADVSKAILPILGRHGLAFTASPTLIEGRLTLAYSLLHEGGDKIEGMYPLTGGTAQELGSSLTYARRYVLSSLTGVAPDADDDGSAASSVKMDSEPRAPREPAPRPPRAPKEPAARQRPPVTKEEYEEGGGAEATKALGVTPPYGMSYVDRASIVFRGGRQESEHAHLESVETLKDDAIFMDALPPGSNTEPFDFEGSVTTLRDLWIRRLFATTFKATGLGDLKVVWQVASGQGLLTVEVNGVTLAGLIEIRRVELTPGRSAAEVLAALGETEKIAEAEPATRF